MSLGNKLKDCQTWWVTKHWQVTLMLKSERNLLFSYFFSGGGYFQHKSSKLLVQKLTTGLWLPLNCPKTQELETGIAKPTTSRILRPISRLKQLENNSRILFNCVQILIIMETEWSNWPHSEIFCLWMIID